MMLMITECTPIHNFSILFFFLQKRAKRVLVFAQQGDGQKVIWAQMDNPKKYLIIVIMKDALRKAYLIT